MQQQQPDRGRTGVSTGDRATAAHSRRNIIEGKCRNLLSSKLQGDVANSQTHLLSA
jgi:hypothetical protein